MSSPHSRLKPYLYFAALLPALLLAPPSATAQSRVLGLDISAWQGNISQTTWNNFHNVENRQFIILRSSRGGTTGYYDQSDSDNSNGLNTFSQRYDDPYFVQNINRVVTAGMYAGAYHFSRPDIIETTFNSGGIRNSGTNEADHFIEMAGPWMRPGYLLPVHDLEAGDGIRTDEEMAQFTVDFSNRIHEKMGIRPAIYVNGNYAQSVLGGASLSLRNQLAQPAANPPTLQSPASGMLWIARWPNQADPNSIDVQNTEPSDSLSWLYGIWDDYGVTHPWVFWQYASTLRLNSFNGGGSNLDADVVRGGIEFLKDQLVPAVWMIDASGDWSTLTNWNSGQSPVAPVPGPGQVARVGSMVMPTPRLPGAVGSGGTSSGPNDTVILERPNTNITVTLSTGNHNIRKLYLRETLSITGGSLTVNFLPAADSTTNGAQFSGPAILRGSAGFSVHTLQVDAPQTFTLGGGALTFDTIKLRPGATPARLLLTNEVVFNARSNVTAVITPGSGSGAAGFVDLNGAGGVFNVGNGSADVDVSVDVVVTNGSLSKTGAGTLRLNSGNVHTGGTLVAAGRLLVNNTTNSGTGTGAVTVTGGILSGTGTIAGPVNVNGGGAISPGTAIGTLTLNSAPVFNGTNFMEIDRNGGAPLADKIVLTSDTLNYGGTLVVSNTGAALTGGEVFTNFVASAYAGSFTTMVLPALSHGLNWYTGRLTTSGSIRVNHAPVANAESFPATTAVGLQIPLASLTSNDSDADGEAIVLASVNLTSTNGITLTTNATHVFYSNSVSGSDQFYYLINDGSGGSATGAVQIIISPVNQPPAISQPPTNQSAISGQNATLAVSATGSTPLAYQWRFNGANLVDATNTSLTLNGVLTNHAGNYSVVVTNNFGAITSVVAALTINYSLATSVTGGGSISPLPNPAGYAPGATVLLTATPNSGFGFFFWSGDVTGTNNPLTVVMTTNQSVTATFLNTNTDIILDNTNAEVAYAGSWTLGTSATDKYQADYRFASTAAGGTAAATYRPGLGMAGYYDVFIWYPQGSNRATNAPWTVVFAGGSTNIPVNQTNNGGAWRLLAAARPFQAGTNGYVQLGNDTGASGKVVLADAVRFVRIGPLNAAPEIAVQPESRTVKVGSNVLFSVVATGVPAPTYQWRFGATNLPGATAGSFTRVNAQLADTGHYSVLVSNVAGSVLSSNALLSVNPWLPVVFQSITAQPDGRVQLVISGNAGEQLWVDWATNLPPAWLPLTNFFNTNGTVQFTDPTNSPQGFYRARQ